eukprot:3167245-Lingulodinium_polyedra.AAC.1
MNATLALALPVQREHCIAILAMEAILHVRMPAASPAPNIEVGGCKGDARAVARPRWFSARADVPPARPRCLPSIECNVMQCNATQCSVV